ncbi:MAG: EAL domain-containing protein, partial [Clostridia bacterium]|nr:EAL domain-containing protein [Clostridia bacterium]
ESAYTENANQMIELIQRLRDDGFEIEMDDFGSGYSSLNMLSSLPIDVLKMDMAFVRNIEHSEKDYRLVGVVLDIARYLNVSVVAEGVETGRQLEMLREAGCDIVQGYYFSRPLPPEEFEELIKKEISIARE